MFNSEQQSLYNSFMDPRISFSNDFVDTQQQEEAFKFDTNYREAPVSNDFEFSVRNYSMIPADEIFCKGMILPLKDHSCTTNQLRKMTLRDELLVVDDDDGDDNDFGAFSRLPKSAGRWKERLGLKKGHILSKKGDGFNGVLERIVEKRQVFVQDEGLAGNNTGSVD